jgi:hypothetical protein
VDLGDVMDDLGAALGTITGLRVFPYWADKIVPPAAIVGFPESIDYDETMGRGADHLQLPVIVVVARRDGRSARGRRLTKYVAGTGTDSVKAAIEAYAATAYHSARVERVEFGTATVAGVEHLSATFDVDVIGPGSGA